MPDRMPRVCRQPGCVERTRDRSGFCQAHATKNYVADRTRHYDQERKLDLIWKLYNCAAWTRFRASFVPCNPICQRLIDGRQCRHQTEIIHHLISPRQDPSKMYTFSNCVGVCRQCHPPDEGTPDWIAGKDFVATVVPTFHF
jgi:hypothetical protein